MIEIVAGVVPLWPSVQAQIRVDALLIGRAYPEVAEVMVLDPARKSLARGAETIAQDVVPDCVHTRELESPDGGLTRLFHARWMPNAAAPCELLGGPYDGERVEFSRDREGFPPRSWSMPRKSDESRALHLADAIAPTTLVREEYRLVGFRPDPAVWVYEYVGTF